MQEKKDNQFSQWILQKCRLKSVVITKNDITGSGFVQRRFDTGLVDKS